MLYAMNSGIARAQTLLVARNVWRKAVSTSKKRDFGERSTLSRRSFIADGLREFRKAKNVSFCQNNREICDKNLPIN